MEYCAIGVMTLGIHKDALQLAHGQNKLSVALSLTICMAIMGGKRISSPRFMMFCLRATTLIFVQQ